MKRVMVVGAPGSGKSTLARRLGTLTGLPVHHMDHLHWKPGWVPRDDTEKAAMAHEIEARVAWIFEGGMSSTYATRAARADTLIWLDLPVSLRLWRVTRRMIQYWGQSRPDLPDGCIEGIHGETLEFYRWIWRTRQSGRVKLLHLLDGQSHLRVFHLKSPDAVRAFWADLETGQ